MLTQAAKRNARAIEAGRLHLHLGGLDALGELSGNFDVVYSINVALFWRDRSAALRAIRAVAATRRASRHHLPAAPRPGPKPRRLQFAEQLSEAMDGLGFIDIRTEQLHLQPLPAVCVLGRRGE